MTDGSKGPLDGIVVMDLSRILAGPTATQLMGDLGAHVIKVEHPARGDDTRSWGPPFAETNDGEMSDRSSYFMSSNRNKFSVALDIATDEGQQRARQIAARADVVIENFKPGGLEKYGLDASTLLRAHPDLVYCSISGFGQTGPNRDKPGYDVMAQGFAGIMALTGEVDGAPMKVGIGIADVMTGMYATVGILAALRHRDGGGGGQHIDLALVDSTLAWTINEGVSHLTTGAPRPRRGNQHPSIVPYQPFACADGHVIVAVGNDAQFVRFCEFVGRPDLSSDARFATNPARLEHRDLLVGIVAGLLRDRPSAEIIAGLEARKVPVGPVNSLDEAFASSQVEARDMRVRVPAPGLKNGNVELIGNPLHFSQTPVAYRRAPPQLGQDTERVTDWLEGRRSTLD